MSQEDVLTRVRATYFGEESEATPGITPAGSYPNAMVRAFLNGEKFLLGSLATEKLDVMDERSFRTAAIAPVLGLQTGSKLDPAETNLKAIPAANQLTATGTPGSFLERLWLRHAFGAEHVAVGTTISGAGSTTTEIDVTSAAAIKKGTFLLIENAAGELEWSKVKDVDTGATPDRVTLEDALSGAPAAGAVVRQMYCFAPADSHSNSLTVQQAFKGSTTAQWTANGCVGDLSFNFPEFGKLATMALALQVTSHTGPSAQGLSTAAASDAMGAPFVFKPKVYLGETINRAAPIKCEGLTFGTKNEWSPVMDPSAPQAISHYVNVGGRPSMVSGSVKTRFDGAIRALFTSRTALRFLIVQKIGTGLTASFWLWEVPAAVINEEPKLEDMKKRLHQGVSFDGTPDTSCIDAGETGIDGDFLRAVGRVCVG